MSNADFPALSAAARRAARFFATTTPVPDADRWQLSELLEAAARSFEFEHQIRALATNVHVRALSLVQNFDRGERI